MTDIFIYIIFGAIVVYDAVLAYRKKRTVTSWFKEWYEKVIVVPFAVSVIFCGHFLNLIKNDLHLIPLIISGLIMLGVSIFMRIKDIKLKKRIYILIPFVLGYLTGEFFW